MNRPVIPEKEKSISERLVRQDSIRLRANTEYIKSQSPQQDFIANNKNMKELSKKDKEIESSSRKQIYGKGDFGRW